MARLITQKIAPWQRWIARIFELVKVVVILTMLGYLAHVFVITLFIVDGASMEPNFFDKEYMLVNKISYNFTEPKRGDVVIDGLYSWEEYTFLKNHYRDDFCVMAVWASPRTRYARLTRRVDRRLTLEEAPSRDKAA